MRAVTVVLIIGLLAWAIRLWQAGGRHHRRGRAGLHARHLDPRRHPRPRGRAGRRDPAHRAAVRGARDPARAARPARPPGGRAAGRAAARRSPSTTSPSAIRTGAGLHAISTSSSSPASASASSASPAAASRPCSRCSSASTTCRAATSASTARTSTRVTQESLRDAITVVPQDVSLFHRSLRENIRYGRPDATDDEVLRGRRCRPLRRFHRRPAARASTRWSATAASSCRAASASASPSPARS